MTASLSGLVILMTLVGAIVGSFVNLVAARLPRHFPIAMTRSRADCCGVMLSPGELVPIVSWTMQKGRCRHCAAPITARHPLVELAGGAIGAWAALGSATALEMVLTALFGWQLLLIALIDADELWLPDRLTAPLLLSGLGATALLADRTIFDAIIGATVGFLVLWGVGAAYRRIRGISGLGGGDPILFAALGAWVGWMGLPSVLLWACIAGLSWVAARRMAGRPLASTEPLPFGPFLAVGGWLTWLYGPIGMG